MLAREKICADWHLHWGCDTFRPVDGKSRIHSEIRGDVLNARPRKMKRHSSAAARAAVRTTDASVDLTRLLDIVASFPRQTICLVGDFVLDEFVSGEISRISREAPVLILRHRHSEAYPGGAANAVNNLADLGARVLPVGVVGDDEAGRTLLAYFQRKRIATSDVIRVKAYATTTNTRYLAGW